MDHRDRPEIRSLPPTAVDPPHPNESLPSGVSSVQPGLVTKGKDREEAGHRTLDMTKSTDRDQFNVTEEGEKEKDSALGRLNASTRMVVGALSSGPMPSSASSDEKGSGSPGPGRQESESSRARLISLRHGSDTPNSSGFRLSALSPATAAFDSFAGTAAALVAEPVGRPETLLAQHQRIPLSAIAQHQRRDGGDVAMLLSSCEEEASPAEAAASANTGGLPADAIQRLRASLFQTTSSDMDWHSILNFAPSYFFSQDSDVAGSSEARELAGTGDVMEARRLWIRQWSDVLSSYTEHVWGDLSPIVIEAQDELQRLEALPEERSDVDRDTHSLERLRQILAHLRGSG